LPTKLQDEDGAGLVELTIGDNHVICTWEKLDQNGSENERKKRIISEL